MLLGTRSAPTSQDGTIPAHGHCRHDCHVGIVSTILYNTGTILLFLCQLAEVSYHTGVFTLWMLPRLLCLNGYELLRKPSQAKNETVPMVSAAVVGLLVTILSGDYTVNYTSLGWLGATLARSLGYMSMLPTMYVVMYCTPENSCPNYGVDSK